MIISNRKIVKAFYLLVYLLVSNTGFSTTHNDNLRLAAICEGGITKLYIDNDVTTLTYRSERKIYNDYTGEVDVYLKVGKAEITEFTEHGPHAYVFYLNGSEVSTSPYEDELFELDYISMINGEMWIVRKNSGNQRITIHNGCQLLTD